MRARRWQVVLAAVAAVCVVVALWVDRRRRVGREARSAATAAPGATARRPLPPGADGGAPAPAARLSVRGSVIDASGRPVADARVGLVPIRADGGAVWPGARRAAPGAGAGAVWRPSGELGVYTGPLPMARAAAGLDLSLSLSTRTDAGGHFGIEGAAAGPALLWADHPSAGRGEIQLTLPASGAEPVVRLAPVTEPPFPIDDAPASGGDGGAPPVPVVVRDRRTQARIRSARVTFQDGQVRVRAPGYAAADVALEPDVRELVVELDQAAGISGRLLDERGDPVVGAEVEAGGARARTGPRGEFALRGVRPGSVTVRARMGAAAGASEVTLLPGESRRDLDLRLGP